MSNSGQFRLAASTATRSGSSSVAPWSGADGVGGVNGGAELLPGGVVGGERIEKFLGAGGGLPERRRVMALTETAQSCSPKLLTLSGRQSSGQPSGIVITSSSAGVSAASNRSGIATGSSLAMRAVSSTGFDGDVDLPRSRVLSGCGVVVVGLELNGRDKADLAVKAAVIEPVDVPPSMFLQA